jgi:tetrahydromethanopterin S-methyltransferase subunit C
MKAFIIIGIVIAAIVGLLFTLRSSRNVGMPSREVLERAQERERSRAADDQDD